MSKRVKKRRRLASRILIGQGALILLAAAIQLAMTAELGRVVERAVSPEAFLFVWPPFALDHIVSGILLVPIGLTTIITANGVALGSEPAWRIAMINALALLSLPIVLVLMMWFDYFVGSPAFLIAAVIISLVGISMIWPLLWARPGGAQP
jgi:hypothetical protein